MREQVDPFTVDGVSWRQYARNIASSYGLALQNSTIDHALWNLTAFPMASEQQISTQLHNVFRTMARGWWKR